MKTRLVLAIAVTCCTLLTACKKGSPSATVTAQAFQEFYMTTSDNPDVSSVAYRIVVTVTNTGDSPIVFDTVQAAFIPAGGKPLIDTTHPYDKTKGTDPDAYAKAPKTASIAPGASETFGFTTDGYTFKLLRDAGNGPLEFVVILVRGRSPVVPVVGPYAAVLPSPNDLPQYEQSFRDKTPGKVLPLRYSRKGEAAKEPFAPKLCDNTDTDFDSILARLTGFRKVIRCAKCDAQRQLRGKTRIMEKSK